MTTRKFNQLLVSLGVTITLLANAYPQASRTVMVQSNTGVLLFPTNLFTANAGAARNGLSLATHATNPVVPVASGGSGATNAAEARTNLGLAWSGLTNTNSAGFRSALSLGTAATNDAAIFQPASTALTNLAAGNGAALTNLSSSNVAGLQAALGGKLSTNGDGAALTNLTGANVTGPVALASNITGTIAITNGGSGATSAAGARTNFGLSLAALTNTNVSGFITSLFGASTNPVLVNSNGSVVDPTNFWQTAPIYSTLQNLSPSVNATNTAINSRSLVLNSLAPSIVNVTNEIELPTTGFAGDLATIIHRGPTTSLTRIKQQYGSVFLSMDGSNQTVRLIFDGTNWSVLPSQSFTEPLYFSSSANASVTRTNIGLGWSALTNTNAATSLLGFTTNGQVVAAAAQLEFTNETVFGDLRLRTTNGVFFISDLDGAKDIFYFDNYADVPRARVNLGFSTNLSSFWTATSASSARTNLGLGWSALTNTNSSVGLVGFTTNGNIVIANTNTNAITITNPIVLNGIADITTPIGLGATLGYFRIVGNTNTNTWASSYDGTNYFSAFSHNGSQLIRLTSTNINYSVPIIFATNTASAETRTNLGLGLSALTNTSNVTVMRALSGSTNTNHPFSGTISVVGTNNTNTLVFSNGILQEVQ